MLRIRDAAGDEIVEDILLCMYVDYLVLILANMILDLSFVCSDS